MEEMTISLADLLAVLVRKGKKIILVGVLFAVLLGAFKGIILQSRLNDESHIAWDEVEYEQRVAALEHSIEATQQKVKHQQDYIAQSLWMQVDPYNKYVAQYYFAISDVDEKSLDMEFSIEETPLDYLNEKIATQYQILWSALDLPAKLGLSQYENVEEKYVREMVSLQSPSSGVLSIAAIGNSEAEAEELVNAAYTLVKNMHDTVARNICAHTLGSFDFTLKKVIDNEMATAQSAHYAEIDLYNSSILEAKKELEELAKPDGLMVAVIKTMIIGGIVGVLLACVWYCCKVLLQGVLQSSVQGERVWKVHCIGSLSFNKGVFLPLANAISGERVWKDEKQALRYICETVKIRADGNQLLVVTTLKQKYYGDMMQKLQSALAKNGIKAVCVDDSLHNAEAVAQLSKCDAVLFVEAVDQTKLTSVSKVLAFAEECSKPVIGFVTV